MKIQAAILVETKQPLAVEEITWDGPLRFGQVLVQLHFSGICGAQINEIEGAKGPDKFLPHLLGHEGSGEVLEVGEGVTRVKPGDPKSCASTAASARATRPNPLKTQPKSSI